MDIRKGKYKEFDLHKIKPLFLAFQTPLKGFFDMDWALLFIKPTFASKIAINFTGVGMKPIVFDANYTVFAINSHSFVGKNGTASQ